MYIVDYVFLRELNFKSKRNFIRTELTTYENNN